MRILLPSPLFYETARCLSDSHLLEQCDVVDRALWSIRTGTAPPWRWEDCEGALAVHMTILSAECRARGLPSHAQPYSDSTWLRSPGWYTGSEIPEDGREAVTPPWLGLDVEYHLDHQRWLLGADPEHYRGYPTFGVGTSVEQTCSQIALQG